jgi:hypothetical protein
MFSMSNMGSSGMPFELRGFDLGLLSGSG